MFVIENPPWFARWLQVERGLIGEGLTDSLLDERGLA